MDDVRASLLLAPGILAPPEALVRETWILDPPAPHERPNVLRPEAASLVDGLLARVAKAEGALDVAIGEVLAELATGDRLLRLGWQSARRPFRRACPNDHQLSSWPAFLATVLLNHTQARDVRHHFPCIAAVRIRAVLSRMMRGSTGRPSTSALRTSLPEMNTGFSSAWFSIRSTRFIEA